ECRLGVADEAARALEDILHPLIVLRCLSRPAVFGMEQRNQIVDQVNGVDAVARDPPGERSIVEADMADVEVQKALPPRTLPCRCECAGEKADELAPELSGLLLKHGEQLIRMP